MKMINRKRKRSAEYLEWKKHDKPVNQKPNPKYSIERVKRGG